MPVRKIISPRGKVGYQWGAHGKVYTGAGAKAKATAQGQAAHAAGYRKKK